MSGERDMTVSRHRAEPDNVEDHIDYLEWALLEDLPGHEAVRCRFTLLFLRRLSVDEAEVVDRLLKDEFERGVAEGRSRERYGEI